MDDEDLIEKLVIKPQNKSPFKYGSREVSNDDAIEVINQLIAVVETLIEIEDDSEDWSKRKEWLNSVLSELWTARGPFPGFPSIMEYMGLNNLISKYISLTVNSEMKRFRDDVRSFVDGKIDVVAGIAPSKADMKRLDENISCLVKLLQILCLIYWHVLILGQIRSKLLFLTTERMYLLQHLLKRWRKIHILFLNSM